MHRSCTAGIGFRCPRPPVCHQPNGVRRHVVPLAVEHLYSAFHVGPISLSRDELGIVPSTDEVFGGGMQRIW